jgi:hypothetical protein
VHEPWCFRWSSPTLLSMIMYSLNLLWRKIRALILLILAQIRHIRRSSLPYISTPPNFMELSKSRALAARTNKVDSNDRSLLKFDIFAGRALRMFILKKNSNCQPYSLHQTLQWRRSALAHREKAGVYRLFSNAYLNSYTANVLPSANNDKAAWPAALVA